jgi:hypothetical protein
MFPFPFFFLLFFLLFAVPLHADVVIKQVPFTARTTAGSQDITTVDLAGATPKGVIVKFGGGQTSDTERTHARISLGWGDATTQIALLSQCEDAQATTDCDSWQETGMVAAILNIDRTILCSMTATLIANGVRLTQAAGCDVAYMGAVILWSGSDVQFKATTFNGPGVLDSAAAVNTIGFQPDIVIGGKTRLASFVAGGQPSYSMNLSMAINPAGGSPAQHGLVVVSQNGQVNGDGAARVTTDRLWTLDVKTDDGAFQWQSYNSSGFSALNTSVANGESVGIAAISINDAVPIYLAHIKTPLAANAGVIDYPNQGFRPQFSWIWMHGLQTVNTIIGGVTATDDPTAWGMVSHDSTNTFSTSTLTQDAAPASPSMKSIARTGGFAMHDNSGAVAWRGTIGHHSSGVVIDYDANPAGSQKEWDLLVIGGAAGAAGGRRRVPVIPVP